ncbi:hypothetical protein [Thermoplasma volcanium GSS1]|uniref:tRNA(Ile2) 2-agmatinylcytidine synthetase TiaS n=1 Tax=Thermoplasma volcanium (strain ATCC 51530 / DSM 4299 / JCM 9571 / NBRC 15438 / GSS1) TaxID=273116 RepID=TIAS_THEVO|nr:tRNA(Ile)(2)-agmatinylcytidine synthase [Thermoplasma volcanium]Q97B59.1 RecName: Full=tRNA(Ile2) 2-agmatinylcytidine synthetase TiaS; Short=tRNA(Ile2)-agm2C synthetase; AltName: Full=tRNA(Ile2) agmatidine synthetase [Thermoplasma volcanium GSS1]BAB59741.1 hypothetical protein [Thermoplasma volcanium GSS1]
MFLAFDDTDSPSGMCTTYLMEEFLRKVNLDVIGYPRLVRLNPNIRYKTRGNGALSVHLGRGIGKKHTIGELHGKILYGYAEGEDEYDENVLYVMKDLVEKYSELDYFNTNPGIVVSKNPFPENYYWSALEREIRIEEAENFITENNGKFLKFKSGRGIIGSGAAISWPATRTTYEILAYKYPHPEEIETEKKMRLSILADTFRGTFNNVDIANKYPAIFPNPKTPVIFGIRGLYPSVLANAAKKVIDDGSINYDSTVTYLTNQATDDHIIDEPNVIEDLHSYKITAEIIDKPFSVAGGHYFVRSISRAGEFTAAAFEPTKEFRHTFSKLMPGDTVTFYGSFTNGNLNVEKMQIISVSRVFSRVTPLCKFCNTRTKSKGKNDFRCPKCGRRYNTPDYHEVKREISPGKYDVPVVARRHLSMPFEIESMFKTKINALEA